MNTLEMKGSWNIVKGKLKQKWARLTDDDLEFAEGKEDELFGRIQKRAGETRERVEEAADEACPPVARTPNRRIEHTAAPRLASLPSAQLYRSAEHSDGHFGSASPLRKAS